VGISARIGRKKWKNIAGWMGANMAFDYKAFSYVSAPGLTAPEPNHAVAIVGAGPI
jgi:hypothetical protein